MFGGKIINISYEQYKKSAEFLKDRLNFVPDIAVVLGSGLGALTREIEPPALRIPYGEIPGFLQSTVESHAGELICGRMSGKNVALMSGRFHVYEGYTPQMVSFYVRVLHLLGVKKLILTNAAGGVNQSFNVGDLMLITDHIKFFAQSPASGKNIPEFGNRFFDLSRLYSQRLRDIAHQCAANQGTKLREGVYFYMPGPEFETPAEIRAIRLLGGDAVGMSTVFEAVMAAQCGIEVLGISVITNMAAGILPQSTVSDDEVTATAAKVSERFCTLIKDVIAVL